MTEDTAWVIEEIATRENTKYSGNRDWCRFPSIDDMKSTEDMEPTTLERCLVYLRDDPFKESSMDNKQMWIKRLYNLVTHEQIMYDDICHK